MKISYENESSNLSLSEWNWAIETRYLWRRQPVHSAAGIVLDYWRKWLRCQVNVRFVWTVKLSHLSALVHHFWNSLPCTVCLLDWVGGFWLPQSVEYGWGTLVRSIITFLGVGYRQHLMGHMNGGHLTLVRVENGRRIFDSSELIKSFGNEFYKMFQKMIVPYQKLQQNSTSLWR